MRRIPAFLMGDFRQDAAHTPQPAPDMSRSGLYLERYGTGPDMVFIHGWGLHGGLWHNVAQCFATRFTVTVIDLPGHGHSAMIDDYSLPAIASCVAEAVPRRAIWVGWSLGGLVGIEAARTRAQVSRLVLIGCSPRFVVAPDWKTAINPALLAQFASDLATDHHATLKRFLALQTHGSEHGLEELRYLRSVLLAHGAPHPAALAGGLRLLAETDLRAALATLEQPVLLVHGERDALVPAAAARSAAENLPLGRVEVIRRAGHAPFLSHPEAFISALEAFLDE